MKPVAIALLTAVIVAICVPLSAAGAPAGDAPSIAALDVCSTSHAAVSLNADSPAIQECLCELSLLACIGFMDRAKHFFQPAVFAIKVDRPPIA